MEDFGLNELFMIGISDIEISKELDEIFKKIRPGSIILTLGFFRALRMKFDSNTFYAEFVKKFCLDIHDRLPGVLISCDHEGGMIQNFAPPDFSLLPPFRAIGELNDLEISYKIGEIMGKELNSIGVDWVFGPVIDCTTHPKYYYRVFGRCLSDDPKICGSIGAEIIRGMQDCGVISCVKHFPNMGGASLDSHRVRPIIESSEKNFLEVDLYPFQKASEAGVMSMMTNHAKYVNIDNTTCATFSKIINIDVLRNSMKFEGVLLTDDLGMGGIYDDGKKEKLNPIEVCYNSLIGGCDVLMYSFQVERALVGYNGILEKIKKGDEKLKKRVLESVERVKKMKEIYFKKRMGKSYPLDVLHCEEHMKIVKKIGYLFGESKIPKRKMTVGMDCSKNISSEEEDDSWWCNIL